ncbi:Response regulator receiver domain-containing protein [Clostridium cavendishii DSM 21758]|uniref:Stage 0 sporulation protein A homolog n=1 Tax=Clostridium cavendishii DSM 21758 TaxID=1121302 RepID=A0A1M6T5T8_9CLOT|nr:response regulator [Clostridium cavendishii]SHK52351.1 Response regulator receiver domain-containing protein [Clostridium cavendishii DSM 21758]
MGKVLIIDDTKNIRVLLTTCLEIKGYEVITAENGKVALEILEEHKDDFELIFLDIRMPGMSGTDVLKVISQNDIKCPVIIMTAFATVKNAIDCTKLGAVAYLQKPFSPERVQAVVEEVIKNRSSEEKCDLNDVQIYINRARKLIEEKEYTIAFEELKIALSIDPYKKEIYYLIGKVNECTNNINVAKKFYLMSEIIEDNGI